jgi:hypothetical protein
MQAVASPTLLLVAQSAARLANSPADRTEADSVVEIAAAAAIASAKHARCTP